MKTIKVVHLIIGLGKGGAETMLYNVIKFIMNFSYFFSVFHYLLTDQSVLFKIIPVSVKTFSDRLQPPLLPTTRRFHFADKTQN